MIYLIVIRKTFCDAGLTDLLVQSEEIVKVVVDSSIERDLSGKMYNKTV